MPGNRETTAWITNHQRTGLGFDGLSTDAYQVEYQLKEDCLSHDPVEQVIELMPPSVSSRRVNCWTMCATCWERGSNSRCTGRVGRIGLPAMWRT